MYFLLNMEIFQPAMLVYKRVTIFSENQWLEDEGISLWSPPPQNAKVIAQAAQRVLYWMVPPVK